VRELGARPIEHRHEIVADRRDPAAAEIHQRLAIGVEQAVEIAFADLDGLVHGQAFDDAPAEPKRGIRLDLGLARRDLLDAPHLAIRDVVKRRDDAARTGLADMPELDQVVRTEPSPRLFHRCGLSLLGIIPRSVTRFADQMMR
jgi:hypothetical protein